MRTPLLILAAVGVVVAFQTVSPGAAGPGRIELTATVTRVQLAHPPSGRRGDVDLVRWSLRDRQGRTIGNANLDCRWHGPQRRLCHGELRLPLGRIVVAGSSETRTTGELTVTGGTGRYLGSSGTLRFRATGLLRLTVTVNLS